MEHKKGDYLDYLDDEAERYLEQPPQWMALTAIGLVILIVLGCVKLFEIVLSLFG